jgi:replication factor C subunit 2/4
MSSYLWVEKYRPINLKDVKGHGKVIELLRDSIKSEETPHMLFYGPPGTGKTSTVLALCNEIYPPGELKNCVFHIDATSTSEMSMKDMIKQICKKSFNSIIHNGRSLRYKIIILDEADSLSSDTQNSLRRCIEIYSYNTRFCFICNYVTKIIPPIVSRCSSYYFQTIDRETALDYMKQICNKEGVEFEESAIESVFEKNKGDMRNILTLLQGLSAMNNKITTKDVENHFIIPLCKIWIEKVDVKEAYSTAENLVREGYTVHDVLKSLLVCLREKPVTVVYKFVRVISVIEKKAIENVPPFILILELLLTYAKLLSDFV